MRTKRCVESGKVEIGQDSQYAHTLGVLVSILAGEDFGGDGLHRILVDEVGRRNAGSNNLGGKLIPQRSCENTVAERTAPSYQITPSG